MNLLEGSVWQAGTAITTMSTKTPTTTPQVQSLGGAFKGVDSSLKLLGINLAPLVGSMGEFGITMTSTVGSVGLLTTAVGTFAAAIGGWKIGQKLKEEFLPKDWDDRIANMSRRGWAGAMSRKKLPAPSPIPSKKRVRLRKNPWTT